MKKVGIVVTNSRVSRYFLNTSAFQKLCLHDDIEIDILQHEYPDSVTNFHGKDILVKKLQMDLSIKKSKTSIFLLSCAELFDALKRYSTTGILVIGFRKINAYSNDIKHVMLFWVSLVLSPIFGSKFFTKRNPLRYFDSKLKNQLKMYDLIICTYSWSGIEIAANANALLSDVKTVCLSLGWDSFFHYHPVKFSHVLSNGHDMTSDALSQYDSEKISEIGAPHLEKLKQYNLDKKMCKLKLGLPENKKVILVFSNAALTRFIGAFEDRLISSILKELGSDGVFHDCILLLRAHPDLKNSDYYECRYGNNTNVIINYPHDSVVESCFNISNSTELMCEYAELFTAADVMVGNLSTAILESAVFKLPYLLCAFDDVYYPSVYVKNSSIFKSMVNAGVTTVYSTERLVQAIYQELNNPSLYFEKLLNAWDCEEIELSQIILALLNN